MTCLMICSHNKIITYHDQVNVNERRVKIQYGEDVIYIQNLMGGLEDKTPL
jgi:hypothetical protein